MNSKWGKKFTLGVFAFLLVFEPPITPIGQIYLTGCIIVMLFLINGRNRNIHNLLQRTKTETFLITIFFLTLYLLIVGLVDILFVGQEDLFDNRLRCLNQLFVLTTIQVAGALYILMKAEQYGLSLNDVFDVLLVAGAIEGFLVIIAYAFPSIRLFFLRYGSELYANPWHFERRGFGFSTTLLDTFGYGIGLLAGVVLFVNKRRTIIWLPYIAMLTFISFLNSRTGLVIIAFAMAMKLICGRGFKGAFGLLVLIAISILVFREAQHIIQLGGSSSSITVRWVTSALEDIYQLVTGQATLEEAQFVSNIISLPTNAFELLFGSGHSVYTTVGTLGFSTDIGYLNLVWIYGILGTAAYYIIMLYLFGNAYSSTDYRDVRLLIGFLAACFFFIQLKANVLGASPGICITYICVLSTIYYNNTNNKDINIGSKPTPRLYIQNKYDKE